MWTPSRGYGNKYPTSNFNLEEQFFGPSWVGTGSSATALVVGRVIDANAEVRIANAILNIIRIEHVIMFSYHCEYLDLLDLRVYPGCLG